jgi:hypothetical protein
MYWERGMERVNGFWNLIAPNAEKDTKVAKGYSM